MCIKLGNLKSNTILMTDVCRICNRDLKINYKKASTNDFCLFNNIKNEKERKKNNIKISLNCIPYYLQ